MQGRQAGQRAVVCSGEAAAVRKRAAVAQSLQRTGGEGLPLPALYPAHDPAPPPPPSATPHAAAQHTRVVCAREVHGLSDEVLEVVGDGALRHLCDVGQAQGLHCRAGQRQQGQVRAAEQSGGGGQCGAQRSVWCGGGTGGQAGQAGEGGARPLWLRRMTAASAAAVRSQRCAPSSGRPNLHPHPHRCPPAPRHAHAPVSSLAPS